MKKMKKYVMLAIASKMLKKIVAERTKLSDRSWEMVLDIPPLGFTGIQLQEINKISKYISMYKRLEGVLVELIEDLKRWKP